MTKNINRLNIWDLFLEFLESKGMLNDLKKYEERRKILSERTKAGLEIAVRNGKKLGRPCVPLDKAIKMIAMRKNGATYLKIKQECGFSIGVIHKIVCNQIRNQSLLNSPQFQNLIKLNEVVKNITK